MPLSDDQKAMLRLLARDQSYEDIAALMGLSVEQVASRAQGAVAQLESEGIPAPTLPPAPEGTTQSSPEPPTASEEPPAPPVAAPTPAAPQPPPPAAAPSPPPAPPKERKPRDKNMLIAIGGGLLGVVVIVVLAVLLIGNSGGDGDSSTTAPDDTTATTAAGAREPTTATLEAVDGSDASGEAVFGRVDETLGLGIEAEGVDPAPKDQIYMVWLAKTPQQMLPLTAVAADKAGRINASYQVPTEAVVYLASGEFDRLVITRADNGRLRSSLEQANSAKDFPAYTGDPVLEGDVVGPIIGAAERLEKRQKEKEAE